MEKKVLKKPELTLVLMAGLPGAGKSTLAKELGAALGWYVLDRDVLKDAILEEEVLRKHITDEDAGRAAYEGFFKVAKSLLVDQHMSIILDSSTLHPFILERAKILASSSGAHLKVILCEVDETTRQHRLGNRLRSRKKRISQSRSYLIPKIASAQFENLPENTFKIDTKQSVKDCKDRVLPYIKGEERKGPMLHPTISVPSTPNEKQIALSFPEKSKSRRFLPFDIRNHIAKHDSLMIAL